MDSEILLAIYAVSCVSLLFSLAAWLHVKDLVDELKLHKGMEARRDALRRELTRKK